MYIEGRGITLEQWIQSSPDCSYWLKEQVRALSHRDSIDALRDAETLLEWARRRVEGKEGIRLC